MTKGMSECADCPSLWALQIFYMLLPNPDKGVVDLSVRGPKLVIIIRELKNSKPPRPPTSP